MRLIEAKKLHERMILMIEGHVFYNKQNQKIEYYDRAFYYNGINFTKVPIDTLCLDWYTKDF